MIDVPKIGMKVRRSGVSADDTLPAKNKKRGGAVGTIVGFVDDDCGATPEDPMLLVTFGGFRHNGFWREELIEEGVKLVGKQTHVREYNTGWKVVALRDLPGISSGVKKGMKGVVFELSNAYGDGAGPMVRFENGHCGNVYDGDVCRRLL